MVDAGNWGKTLGAGHPYRYYAFSARDCLYCLSIFTGLFRSRWLSTVIAFVSLQFLDRLIAGIDLWGHWLGLVVYRLLGIEPFIIETIHSTW